MSEYYIGDSDKLDLKELETTPPKDTDRDAIVGKTEKLGEELADLQDLMWGARTRSVVVVLQGRDSAGKDGAIKHVVGFLNPRGVHVTSFGVPNKLEMEHDYLWRVHQVAPRRGEIAVYNRSHYEDVLVVRVHELVSEKKWRRRYDHIRNFEEMLVDEGAIVMKYFLHISKDEQKKRLLEREASPSTAWKLNVGDWQERELWKEYTAAYEDALGKTAQRKAPWIVVPADAKWYRNYVLTKTLVEAIRPYRTEFEEKLVEVGKAGRTELDEYRLQRENQK